MVTRRIVLIGLLKGLHSDFGSRWDERHVAVDNSIHGEEIVLVQTPPCLQDGQAVVPRVKLHLRMPSELGTWQHK